MESHVRSIIKTTSYRIAGTLVTFSVAWLVIRKLELSVQIGLLDTVFKIGAFYGHERLWNNISFGRKKPPDYEI